MNRRLRLRRKVSPNKHPEKLLSQGPRLGTGSKPSPARRDDWARVRRLLFSIHLALAMRLLRKFHVHIARKAATVAFHLSAELDTVETTMPSAPVPERHRQPKAVVAPRTEPRDRRGAEKCDQISPSHSITSSAAARSVRGTVRPSALAVLRLMITGHFSGPASSKPATRVSRGRAVGVTPRSRW